MTVSECYAELKGDYEGAMGRLMKEERIRKYLLKFSESADYDSMISAIEAENWEDAFRFSHNLKGMSANLGLSVLFDASAKLCDVFRNGAPTEDFTAMLQKVKEDYQNTICVLAKLA